MERPAGNRRGLNNRLSAGARLLVAGASSTVAAALAAALVTGWFVVGLVGGFPSGWFDLLAAVTGAVTFLMVFLIQHTTGVENRAVLLKLDELIRATEGARNDLIAAEHRSLEEQDHLKNRVGGQAGVAGG